MNKQQQTIVERLLYTLTVEQDMRFKSEQQHSKVVDNLVQNQVMMEEQVKLHKERQSNMKVADHHNSVVSMGVTQRS